MIERYTRPEMAKIWTDDNRFRKMLEVEILACEVLSERGWIPAEALKTIKKKADIKNSNRILYLMKNKVPNL